LKKHHKNNEVRFTCVLAAGTPFGGTSPHA